MSLESLRTLRRQAEEAVTMELAQITQQLAQLERRYQALDAEIHTEAAASRAQAERGMVIEEFLECHRRIEAGQALMNDTQQAIDNLTKAWVQTQNRLVEASQERKIVERLMDRRQQEQEKENLRREQQATDDAASRSVRSIGDSAA
jgi:flagellar export protein FliJ